MPSSSSSALLTPSALSPAVPATFAGDYKPCACFGKSPTRACRHCFSTGWLKLCQTCFGQGTLSKSSRQSNAQGRTERCGFCMGVGWLPCPKAEIARAEELTGEISTPAALAPPSAATEKRQQIRRSAIKKSKKSPAKPSPRGVSIAAERVQNPVEAMELEREGDSPRQDSQTPPAPPAPQTIEVAPSSFAAQD